MRRIRGRALDVIATRLDDESTDIATALTVLAAVTSDTVPTWNPPNPEGLLDGAMNITRINLPPLPRQDFFDLDDPLGRNRPSDIERAERATIERLADAAGIDEDPDPDMEDQP